MVKHLVRLLVLAAILLGSNAPAWSAKPIILKFGSIAPEGSAWHDAMLELRQSWLDLSDGTVELRIYPGGVLGDEVEMVRKVRRRGLDGVAISGSALPRIDEIVECLNMPMLFETYEQLDEVRRQISADVEAKFEQRGFKLLAWAEAGWVHFFTEREVHTPDDLRSLRLWTTPGSPEYERLLASLGFQVVPLPATDMLTSLQTGLIEAIDVPPLFALLDRSYQIASYMMDLKWAPLNAAVLLSVPAWNRIPDALKPELLSATSDVVARLRSRVHRSESEAISEMKTRGLKIVELTDEDRRAWRAVVDSGLSALPCPRTYPAIFEKVVRIRKQGG